MICQKLKSKSGASLSIAMLVFLVCAVLGVVCVAAATVSAGRLSKLAENDRRYYAVASAAELLAGELCPTQPAPVVSPAPSASPAPVPVPITITRKLVEKQIRITTCSVDDSVNPPRVTRGSTETHWDFDYSTDINNTGNNPGNNHVAYTDQDYSERPKVETNASSSITFSDRSFLTAAALKLMFGNKQCNTDPAMDYTFTSGLAGHPDLVSGKDYIESPLKLTHAGSTLTEDDLEALNIDGTYRLYQDGTLALYITSDDFTVIVTLVPEISQERSQSSEDAAPEISGTTTGANGKPCYTEKRTRTTTTEVTATISWTVDSIRKEVSTNAES